MLEFRIDKLLEWFPNPHIIPNFIDDINVPRFLASSNDSAFQQALAFVFTIPGIPTLLRGAEQGLLDTRMAMFSGGWRSPEGSFDAESTYFQHRQRLTAPRRDNQALRRGGIEVLASDAMGPSLFAYRGQLDDDVVLVLFNTADRSILVDDLDVGVGASRALRPLFSERAPRKLATDADGRLDVVPPPRATLVLAPDGVAKAAGAPSALTLAIAPLPAAFWAKASAWRRWPKQTRPPAPSGSSTKAPSSTSTTGGAQPSM